MFGPLRKTFFALFVSTSYKVHYLLCGQPYTSTLIEMRSFHVCGLNLRYLASNTLTSLRTTVSWSVLPVRVCKIKMITLCWASDLLHLMLITVVISAFVLGPDTGAQDVRLSTSSVILIYLTVNVRAVFTWVSKINWFYFTTIHDCSKILARFLGQSEVKSKPIVINSHRFSRALRLFNVLIGLLDCLCFLLCIWCRRYFGAER